MSPFKNESESLIIGDLTSENHVDRVSIYGSIDIMKDKVGLKMAREIYALMGNIILALEADKALPEVLVVAPNENTEIDPFGIKNK